MNRALQRTLTRGPIDTAIYSFGVIQNAVANLYLDLRYGRRISTTRHSEAEQIPGVHQIMHSDWKFLNNTFKNIQIKPTDVLVDAGCGDGRVISYWLSRGFKNKLVGIEIDKDTAKDCAMRFARFKNVEIIHGDASELAQQSGGTIFYLANSFSGEMVKRFADVAERMGAMIIFYSYNELSAFKHWKIERFLKPGQDPAYWFAILTPLRQSQEVS